MVGWGGCTIGLVVALHWELEIEEDEFDAWWQKVGEKENEEDWGLV